MITRRKFLFSWPFISSIASPAIGFGASAEWDDDLFSKRILDENECISEDEFYRLNRVHYVKTGKIFHGCHLYFGHYGMIVLDLPAFFNYETVDISRVDGKAGECVAYSAKYMQSEVEHKIILELRK